LNALIVQVCVLQNSILVQGYELLHVGCGLG
jgi:hypothetical protein